MKNKIKDEDLNETIRTISSIIIKEEMCREIIDGILPLCKRMNENYEDLTDEEKEKVKDFCKMFVKLIEFLVTRGWE